MAFLRNIYRAAHDALGGIDILVANTGGPPARSALNAKIEEWAPRFEAMVLPVMKFAAWVLPGMRERHFGRSSAAQLLFPIQP